MKSFLSYITLLAVAATMALLSGCGGGDNHRSATLRDTTSASLTIHWPERARLIPLAAESIKVVVSGPYGFSASQTVARPTSGNTSTIAFPSIPVGELTFTATAYPNANGTGVAQATASVTQTARVNEPVTVSLTMGSTITQVEITPANPTLVVSTTTTLTATAKNAAGEVVLVPVTDPFTWSSSNEATATVTGGVVSGVAQGQATITATEKESGKSGTVPVTVQNAPQITVTLHTAFFGLATDVPWVAFRDGDGAWQPATRTGVGTYTGTVTNLGGRYGFACAQPSGELQHDIWVAYATTAETTEVRNNYVTETPNNGTTIAGTIANMGQDDQCDIYCSPGSGSGICFAPGTNYSLYTPLPAGSYTLAAGLYADGAISPYRMIRRHVSLPGGEEQNLDFASSEAFATTGPYTITVPSGADRIDIYSSDCLALGGANGATATYRGIPSEKLASDEGHIVYISQGSIFYETEFREAGDKTITLPTALPWAPAHSSGAFGSIIQHVVTMPTYPGAQYYGVSYTCTDGHAWNIQCTAGWLAEDRQLATPNLSGVAGWNTAWDLGNDGTMAAIDAYCGMLNSAVNPLADDGHFIDGNEYTEIDQSLLATRALRKNNLRSFPRCGYRQLPLHHGR